MKKTPDEVWLNTAEALEIAQSYPKGFNSKAGLISAGILSKFSRKDGFHWEFNKAMLIRYCEISNKVTLMEIAGKAKTSIGSIKYLAMKHNIPFHVEMGRKYLTNTDADKLLALSSKRKDPD